MYEYVLVKSKTLAEETQDGDYIDVGGLRYRVITATSIPGDDEIYMIVLSIGILKLLKGVPVQIYSKQKKSDSTNHDICNNHELVQHRDGKEPWCKNCGMNYHGLEPKPSTFKDHK